VESLAMGEGELLCATTQLKAFSCFNYSFFNQPVYENKHEKLLALSLY